MAWPEEIHTVASLIKPDDFFGEKYRRVFQFLVENDGGDFITVSTALPGVVKVEELLNWTGIESLSAFLPRYCADLKEIASKQRLFEALGRVRLMANERSFSQMLDETEAVLTAMGVNRSNDPLDAKFLIKDAAKRLKQRRDQKGVLQGISYGIELLDQATSGMHPGELIVVAGRPSMGKSAFAGNVLENSCRSGSAGILFTMEMDHGNCIDRMLSSVGGIRYGNMRSGNLEDVDWAKNMKASNEINDYRMFMDDTPAIGLREINSKCRKLKRNGLNLVVIDYLQLMATNSAITNRVQAIGEISRGLKRMARELECTVMLLSQLNRGVDGRMDKRPTMSDLRDSGEIEQDADVILFPFRNSAYCQKCKDNVNDGDHDPVLHKRTAEVIIEKQRNGERNISVPLVWFGEYQRFQG